MIDIAPFEQLLKRSMGLDAASIGLAAVERAVQERLSACRLPDAHSYWNHLAHSADELQALIEAVVVPETWFFRDAPSFAALAQLTGHDSRRHETEALRILSIPCSTGEEPCSIAMSLLDAGVRVEKMRIDAVDISERALARAARAIYGRNSFRGSDLAFRDRHFVATADGYRPSNLVLGAVHYQRGNILTDFAPEAGLYDVIFCRNLLIYFDRPTQDRAVASLGRMLKPAGWMFVGAAETALLSDHGFISAKLPFAFAFRKASAADEQSKQRGSPRMPKPARESVPPTWHPQQPPRQAAPQARSPRAPAVSTVKVAASPPPAPAADARVVDETLNHAIAHARQLADLGHLDDAAARCEAHLREHGPCAATFHLLGLVHDASGRLEHAAAHYRKALYLEPEHHEALIHLSLILQRQGDVSAAERLQRRADRIAPADRV
jgi:chemotaxis protein methyltransferase WspC